MAYSATVMMPSCH